MTKYQVVSSVIEAIQWDGTPEKAQEIVGPHGYIMQFVDGTEPHIVIEAGGSGRGCVYRGDWIIKHRYAGYAVLGDTMFLALTRAAD